MRVRTADGTFLDAAHLQTTRTAKGAHRAFTWGASTSGDAASKPPTIVSKPGSPTVKVLLPVKVRGQYEVAVWAHTRHPRPHGGFDLGVAGRHWNSGTLRVR
jgi:hypothetical protein